MGNTKHIHYCCKFIQDTVYQVLSESATFHRRYYESILAYFFASIMVLRVSQKAASMFHKVSRAFSRHYLSEVKYLRYFVVFFQNTVYQMLSESVKLSRRYDKTH